MLVLLLLKCGAGQEGEADEASRPPRLSAIECGHSPRWEGTWLSFTLQLEVGGGAA